MRKFVHCTVFSAFNLCQRTQFYYGEQDGGFFDCAFMLSADCQGQHVNGHRKLLTAAVHVRQVIAFFHR
jgi:hypothetical protein